MSGEAGSALGVRRRLAFGLPAFAYLALANAHRTIDDSFIVATYARAWVEEGELAWFGVRSEGFSDPLWVAVHAAAVAAGADPIAVAKAVSFACGLALVGVLARWLPSGRAGDVAFAALVAWTPVAVWAVMGLETMAFTLAVTLGFGGLSRGRPAWLAALGVAAALRFEGFAWLVAGAAWGMGRHRRLSERLPAAAAVVVVAALHVVRARYFGRTLPSPALLKATLGWFWVPQLLEETLSAAGILVVVLGTTRLAGRDRGLALTPLALSLATLVGMGGDWMAKGRMLLPGLMASAVAWMCLGEVRRAPRRGWLLVVAVASLIEPRFLEAPRLRALWPRVHRGLETPLKEPLRYLVQHAPEGAVVQTADVGMVSHIPGLTILDSRGLVSPFFLDVRREQAWGRVRARYAEAPPDVIAVGRYLPEDLIALGLPFEAPEGLDPWLEPVDDLLDGYPHHDDVVYREDSWRGVVRMHRRTLDDPPIEVRIARWRTLAERFPSQPFFREELERARAAKP